MKNAKDNSLTVKKKTKHFKYSKMYKTVQIQWLYNCEEREMTDDYILLFKFFMLLLVKTQLTICLDSDG